MDAGSMSRDKQIGLLANLKQLQAQQQIFDGRYDRLDYQAVHSLYLEAYGDERLASEARLESMKQLVREETEAARIANRGGR